MAKRGGNGGRGSASYGGGVGNSSTNYADSVGTPTGRMNARGGSTQIAGAPREVSLGSGNPNTLQAHGTQPAFPGGSKPGRPPGLPSVNHKRMLETDGAQANATGSQQAAGAGGSQVGKGKPWANFSRHGGGTGVRRGGSP